jgi:hypothetical protein
LVRITRGQAGSYREDDSVKGVWEKKNSVKECEIVLKSVKICGTDDVGVTAPAGVRRPVPVAPAACKKCGIGLTGGILKGSIDPGAAKEELPGEWVAGERDTEG